MRKYFPSIPSLGFVPVLTLVVFVSNQVATWVVHFQKLAQVYKQAWGLQMFRGFVNARQGKRKEMMSALVFMTLRWHGEDTFSMYLKAKLAIQTAGWLKS